MAYSNSAYNVETDYVTDIQLNNNTSGYSVWIPLGVSTEVGSIKWSSVIDDWVVKYVRVTDTEPFATIEIVE